MNQQEKLEFLQDVMDYEETLAEDMILDDIEEWDSLSRLTLTLQVNTLCGKNLSTKELQAFTTVKDICDYLDNVL